MESHCDAVLFLILTVDTLNHKRIGIYFSVTAVAFACFDNASWQLEMFCSDFGVSLPTLSLRRERCREMECNSTAPRMLVTCHSFWHRMVCSLLYLLAYRFVLCWSSSFKIVYFTVTFFLLSQKLALAGNSRWSNVRRRCTNSTTEVRAKTTLGVVWYYAIRFEVCGLCIGSDLADILLTYTHESPLLGFAWWTISGDFFGTFSNTRIAIKFSLTTCDYQYYTSSKNI